ncbi:MAG: SDR family oxidoreductase [Opitutales bacterium]|nr:SDR family oxidoreductase [Opitutales bacterium]
MQAPTFITGANRGIGLALTEALLAADHSVVATCRNPQKAGQLHALGKAHPHRLRILPLDVTDDASVDSLAATLIRDRLPLALLINNAGAMEAGFGLDNANREEFDRVFRTNVSAPFFLVKSLLPCLRMGAPARVVQISSILGSIASRTPEMGFRCYAYNSSKCALNMLSVMLAEELAGDQIDVTLLHPGWVATEMGGKEAPLQPRDSAAGLLRVIGRLQTGESGQFLDYEGNPLPW